MSVLVEYGAAYDDGWRAACDAAMTEIRIEADHTSIDPIALGLARAAQIVRKLRPGQHRP